MKTIDDLVYGHSQAKKVLKVLINRSQERYYKKCVKNEQDYPERLNCLLIGPSGTGKTHLMKSLADMYKFPLICLDATELMPTGNDTGINKKQLRKLIFDTANDYVKKPEYHSIEGVLNQMVIFVDEFDKLATSFDSSGNWNKHVQSSFLTMIEDKYELSGISWVFAGAFTMCRENKVVKKSIGFFPEDKMEAVTDQLTEKDIIKAGIIPEMLGRIPLIVQLDTLNQQDYVNIVKQLLESKYSVLTNVNVEEVAKTALDSGQGVRSVIRQLELALIDHDSEQPWVMPTF
jgi:ATP-dependent Clp protease ATP-binding subunit ClpX